MTDFTLNQQLPNNILASARI